MAKCKYLGLLMLIFAGTCYGNKTVSKTFLSITPPYQSGSPEYVSLWNHGSHVRNSHRFCIEFTPFVGRSIQRKPIAQYFLPFGSDSVIVAGDRAYNALTVNNAGDRTVNATHLNIVYKTDQTDPYNIFKSIVYFSPRHTFYGLGIHAKYFFGECDGQSWWLDVSAPIMHVKNNMHLCEKIQQTGESLQDRRVADATEVFKQSSWNYEKIDGSRCKSGLADVEAKLGYELFRHECADFDLYVGVVVPTGTRPHALYVFEPIIGNNHHWGLMAGCSGVYDIATNQYRSLSLLYDFNMRYLFHNHQARAFDLIDNSWSRYMEVYANRAAAQAAFAHAGDPAAGDRGAPGINYFTTCMNVTPGFAESFNIWLQGENNKIVVEFGYCCRARQEESVHLRSGWDQTVALVGVSEGGQTSSARNIRYNYVGTSDHTNRDSNIDNGEYTAVLEESIDLQSAACPAVIKQTLFGSLGHLYDMGCIAGCAAIGASWQFSGSNVDVNRWMLWGKIDISF